jgi:hypothetical protein
MQGNQGGHGMTRTQESDFPRVSRALFGALLAGIGLLVLLDRIGQVQVTLLPWWPMILVVFGLNKLLRPASERQTHRGLHLIVIGFWLQACTMGWFGLTFANSWPLLLVLYGLSIIIQAGHDGFRHAEVRHERHD